MRPTLFTACILAATTLLPYLTLTAGALLNITVDDQDPTTPTTSGVSYTADWLVARAGQSCLLCVAHVDPSQARDGTWHEAVYDPADTTNPAHGTPQNATLEFTGSAVYVYGIQAQSMSAPFGGADIVFYIDGTSVGDYEYIPTSPQDSYVYNKLLFFVENLPNAPHNLTIQNGRLGGSASLALLDYIVYSQGEGNSSEPQSSSSANASSPTFTSAPSTTPTSVHVEPVPTPTTSDASQSTHHHLGAAQVAAICISVAAVVIVLALGMLVRRARQRLGAAKALTAPEPFEGRSTGGIEPQYRLSDFKPLKDARQGTPVVSWMDSTRVGTPIADAMMCASADERVEQAATPTRGECACGVGPPAYEHVSHGVL